MLQHRKKIIIAVVSLLCVLSVGAIVSAAYLNTNRDTRKAPEPAKSSMNVTSDYQTLYETDKFVYSFREDRDIIAVKNKETGYTFKTGIDAPFKRQVSDAKDAVLTGDKEQMLWAADDLGIEADTDKEKIEKLKELADTPVESSMIDNYVAMANSLITVEYFNGSNENMTTERISSAAYDSKDAESSIQPADGSSETTNKWVLKVVMKGIDLGINVYITLGDDGSISYDVPYDEITGKGIDVLSSIIITPFLGASGGEQLTYNKDDMDWTNKQEKEITPGYIMIPDGSGTLMRFKSNSAQFTSYEGSVYGGDPAANSVYYDSLGDSVPLQSPSMPVFGISHGDGTQAAFVAYADGGDEYMKLVASPQSEAENAIKYTYVYPVFEYNMDYYEVTTQSGDTYRKTREKPNKFDIKMTYSFLYGDGSDGQPKADYTGMALKYRQHLIEEGVLTEQTNENDSIPIRLDFLMSDSKKGIISTTEVKMTSTKDVDSILGDVRANGINNINSGLIGWQKAGETLSKPGSAKYSRTIGKEKDFANLFTKYAKDGVDISVSRDFTTINKTMISYYNNAAKHNNTQYLTVDKSNVLPENAPVTNFGYALPTRSAEWVTSLFDDVSDFSKSFTIAGISNKLVSSHNSDGSETTVSDAVKLYQNAISKIKENGTKINMDSPNEYLWKYTDRYLQSPVGTSQYVYETDTVPFLQMVLNGTMEVYAPYSNFSFYAKSDMLRMIDYNISPSFILTKEPSYLLASTASAEMYSTEYDQYAELIQSIYKTVNDPLSKVIGYKWTGRTVLEDGVIMNTYSNGSSEKAIIINYTDDNYDYNGYNVEAQSAKVIEGGIN